MQTIKGLSLFIIGVVGAFAHANTVVNCESLNGHKISIDWVANRPAVMVDSNVMATYQNSAGDDYTRTHGGIYILFTGGLEFRGDVDTKLNRISSGVLSGPEISLVCRAP